MLEILSIVGVVALLLFGRRAIRAYLLLRASKRAGVDELRFPVWLTVRNHYVTTTNRDPSPEQDALLADIVNELSPLECRAVMSDAVAAGALAQEIINDVASHDVSHNAVSTNPTKDHAVSKVRMPTEDAKTKSQPATSTSTKREEFSKLEPQQKTIEIVELFMVASTVLAGKITEQESILHQIKISAYMWGCTDAIGKQFGLDELTRMATFAALLHIDCGYNLDLTAELVRACEDSATSPFIQVGGQAALDWMNGDKYAPIVLSKLLDDNT
jgi:hypothetical protein